MSEPIDKDTLLPDNRTTFERSYEEGTKALVKSEDVSDWINNPLETKAELLDLMAAESGVLDWFYSDSEEEKRSLINQSYLVHQKAGTIAGLKEAFLALGIDADVYKGDLPYSIRIESYSNKAMTDELLSRLVERAQNYKSLRDSFTIALGIKAKGKQYVGGGVTIAPRINIGPWVPPSPEAVGFTYVAGSVTAAMRVHIQ